MAYRYEKQADGKSDLIIDGFEKGIADSPYQGIANLRNVNIKYYPGVAYANYKRQAATLSGGTMKAPQFSCVGDTGIKYIIDGDGQVWKQASSNSSTFNLLGSAPTTGASGQGIAFWQNYLIVFRTNFIDFCGDGTGDGGVTSSNWNTNTTNTPLGNITNMVFTATVNAADTQATISTYTDAGGNSRSTTWFGFSGTYQLLTSAGEKINARFVNGSGTVTFNTPAQVGGTSSGNHVNVLTGVKHMSIVSRNDGYLYFCNGSIVSALQVPIAWAQTGGKFNVGTIASFNFLYDALAFPATETANWLDELGSNLVIAGNFNLYQWDRLSTSYQTPVPIPEQIFKIINSLNNIYIFAGYKGNIYLSNGYSISPFKKIPDYIANNSAISVNDKLAPIDPQWQWGGVMSHRLRLYFQALAFDSATGNQLLAGIFSVGLVNGNGITLEQPGSLVMENQNSFGLVSITTSSGGILIDNSILASQYDSYYSAWSNGILNAGGIDFNDTTLYSNNEMLIETDLVAVGTSLVQKTFSQAEFKLDQALQSGDSISLYARKSLADPYTLLGTATTSPVLSFASPFSIEKLQWLQLMATMSCNATATSSSFTRLREIRIR